MQDIAWEHADISGFGYDRLKRDQQFWVLSRLLMKIRRRPEWGEDFILETWSRGTDGFFAYRDFNFLDQSEIPIIQATSSWLILNLQSKRIVRLSDFKEFPAYKESIFNSNPVKVGAPKNDGPLHFTPVLFYEIDINQHFNTGRYIERIMNAFDFPFHQKHELTELEVNFLKEGLPSDRLAVKKEFLNENNQICSVVRESDNADLVRARLGWKNR